MNALVAGYGRMGAFHAKTLRDLGYHVTTVDPNPGQLADHQTLDAATGPYDVAAVAVPAVELVHTAYLLAGTPRLLVEKPFALNVRDASMLAAYLAERGSKVCVGLVERFNPQARALRALMRDGTLRDVSKVRFTRWNDRPSFHQGLDLKLHDLDLAHYLQVSPDVDVEFDTRDRSDRKVRAIEVTHAAGVLTVDLMDHALSPLHGLWHAFLTGQAHPTPRDAIRALQALQRSYQPEMAAAA